jgi:putative peptidoglycan lipid II flippase
MAVLYAGVRHAGMSISFRRPRMTPNVKRLLVLAFPAAITGGITQINQLIGQMIASTKDGAIAALQYADRIYQLPLGVVGIAVGVVLLPELSRSLRAGHLKEAMNIQNRSMEFVMFLTLPAAAAIWVLSDEIIRVVYEHGAFNPSMTATVAGIIAIYGLGLPGFVMIKALNPGFFAREDTRTPMRFTMVSVAVNCALALSLFPFFHERGIATAEVVSGWISTTLLFTTLVRRGHLDVDRALVSRLIRLLIAAAVMAGVLEYASIYAAPYIASESGLLEQIGTVFVLIGIAMVVYFGVAFAIGGASLGMLRRNMKRGAATPTPIPGDE